MSTAEVLIFSTPACPACREVEAFLAARGIAFRSLDVSADPEGLTMLLRFAGQPVVPTVVAYGEVMVGFDQARLEQMLQGLEERADTLARADAEEAEQLRESEAIISATLEASAAGQRDEGE